MVKELAIAIFKERGIHVTFPRVYILSLLISGRKMINLQDIIVASSKKINRVTAYRTLTFFCDVGIFYKILDNRNKAHYALNSALTSSSMNSCSEHFHFQCNSCGNVKCLPIPFSNTNLPEGFVKTGANLLLTGLCPECSTKHGADQPQSDRNNMKSNLLILFLLFSAVLWAQSPPCLIALKGNVKDRDTKATLVSAIVYVDSSTIPAFSNRSGSFLINNICPGKHTFKVLYTGYDSFLVDIVLNADTTVAFTLIKAANFLSAVTVTSTEAKKTPIATIASSDLKGQALFQTRGATLGETLKSIPGLNSIQTGPSISKPVIHGLHSNRVLVLNNGIRQEGQQWGSEHAPEIDPFIASKITIIKGAASVRYGSDAVAGVILLEPRSIDTNRNVAGELNLVGATNGRMGAVSGLIEGKLSAVDGLSWRVQGTLKRAGNFKTPNYYLKNTGLSEEDFSLTTAYRKHNFDIELYYSKFHNKLGIFEGSHVGNVTDLYAAFKRDIPLTPSYFSYDINRTYQDISHDLFKASSSYHFHNGNKIELVYADQKNLREEYDIDLPYSTDPDILSKPQISFQLKTQSLDLIYEMPVKNHFSGSLGITSGTQGNVFKGIRYLVPNFRNYSAGAFAIEKYTRNKLTLEAGVRYDYRWLRVYKLNNTTLSPYNTTTDYRNITGTIGATYKFSPHFSINGNIGTAWRAPSVNELYIDGVHLSAASYERGDSSLKSERSYNFTLSAKYESEQFSAELVLYDNVVNNFIYAKPSLLPIQLISGTYPFFQYTQVNANLRGTELDITYRPLQKFSVESKTSIVRAWNRTIHDYLVFIPADRFDNAVRYNMGKIGHLHEAYVGLQNVSVLRQSRVPPNSDYVDPPPGYSLFNVNAGFNSHVFTKDVNISISVNNILNTAYRDYLNRFRYYCDDLGINAVIRLKINF